MGDGWILYAVVCTVWLFYGAECFTTMVFFMSLSRLLLPLVLEVVTCSFESLAVEFCETTTDMILMHEPVRVV